MNLREHWRVIERNPTARTALFVTGLLLMGLVAPAVGILPGPGGVFVFAFGLGMALRYSHWAKRRYVAFKRRWPKHGAWTDWGLRRQSAKRRAQRAEIAQD